MGNYSEEQLLDEINDQKAVEYIPINIYIAILFITGLIGNAFVLAFYSDRSRLTPTTRLIFMVAVIDEIICCVMPETFAELTIPYKFTNTAFCKIYYFINYILCLWESYVLLFIGVFRYRKICVPFKKQFTLQHANYFIVLAFFMALLITFPIAIFFEAVPIPLTVRENITITGHECNTSIDSFLTFQLVHNILILMNLTVLSTSLLTLYGLTVKTLRSHNNKIGLLEAKAGTVKRQPGHLAVQIQADEAHSSVVIHHNSQRNAAKEFQGEGTEATDSNKLNKTDSRRPGKTGLKKIPPGMTTMLFMITVIFIISYLPYLVMTIISTITNQKYRSRSNWIQFISQSYRLNSVLNPFVYGYYNQKFRKFVYSKICQFAKCLFRKK